MNPYWGSGILHRSAWPGLASVLIIARPAEIQNWKVKNWLSVLVTYDQRNVGTWHFGAATVNTQNMNFSITSVEPWMDGWMDGRTLDSWRNWIGKAWLSMERVLLMMMMVSQWMVILIYIELIIETHRVYSYSNFAQSNRVRGWMDIVRSFVQLR